MPTAQDDVTIGPNVTVTVSTGSQAVHALTMDPSDTLDVTNGSLTVNANSSLASNLAISGGMLAAAGSNVSVMVDGSITVTGGNLSATDGATLGLPTLTKLTGNFVSLQADGTGSRLDISAMTDYSSSAFAHGSSTPTAAP